MNKIITKEVVELNTEDVYRLKDKEGWFGSHVRNEDYFADFEDIEKGFKLDYVFGDCGEVGGHTIISEEEYEFFEVVQESVHSDNHLDVVKGTLWDGKAPIEVGMIVKTRYNALLEVVFLQGAQVVLTSKVGTICIIQEGELKSAAKTKKEATLDKALTAWQGKHLDYAYDTKSSTVPFGEVFDLIYDVMEEK
jgi:hypothetical protein